MSRRWLAIASWVIGLAPIIVVAGQQRPTFRVGVDLVTVDVSVNRGGHPVSGLTLDNFIVFDNGVKQRLEGLIAEQVPLDAVLVLDTSGSLARNRLSQLKSAAGAFLDGLSPQDRLSLITFSHQILVRCPLTADRSAVRSVLSFADSRGATALYDATYVALRLSQAGNHRVVAVVFTDGLDNASWLSQDRVVDAATRSDVVIYGVTLSDDVSPANVSPANVIRVENQSSYTFLRSASEATGGRLFPAATGDKLRDAFARVLQDIRARYLLRYSPEKITPGWHKLEVRLQGAKGEVTARRGYFVER
jgi:VWFA-related protein